MKDRLDDYVVCPFYTGQYKQRMQCTGINENTRLHLYFKNNESMKEHKNKFCRDIFCYDRCPLYKAIAKQFEEEKK